MSKHIPLSRKIGIGIVLIIPGFVFAGLIWSLAHSWFGVLIWEIIMAIIYSLILKGKLFLKESTSH